MNKSELDSVINSITRFSSTRSYWFVRTQGGDYYDTFIQNSYIAIGYDNIRLSTVKGAYENSKGKIALVEAIKERFPDENRPGYIATQIIDFTYNIKQGDIVIIPSASSGSISIGEVVSTPVYEVDKRLSDQDCPFLKRKEVKWIKLELTFEEIDTQLIKLKYHQRTVSKIPEDLTPFIDRTILPLYIKDDNAHLALNVRKKDSQPAYMLFSTWAELLELSEEFGNEKGLEINKEDFDLRINVQSPGTIEFITYTVIGIVTLSVIVAALIGAEIETKSGYLKFQLKFKSGGLLKSVSDFMDRRRDRIIKSELISKVQSMDINPNEIIGILEQINKRNESDG